MTITTWESVFEEEELSPEQELMRQLREAQRHQHEEMRRRLREHRDRPAGVTNNIYGRSFPERYQTEPLFRSTLDEADVDADEIVQELEQAGSDDSDDEQQEQSRFDAIVHYLRGLFG